MSKKAFLVGFAPLTRIVIDVPEGFNAADADTFPEVRDSIIAAARERIVSLASEKLDGDNCDRLEEDVECPYEPKYVWAVFSGDGSRLYQYPVSKYEDQATAILIKARERHPDSRVHLERIELSAD